MPQDDEIQDMDSSDMSNDDALDPKAGVQPDRDQEREAGSSPATGDAEDEGLLGVVRDVVAKREGADEDPQAVSPAEGEEDTGSAESRESEGDDDYSDVPFGKHPRFKKLIRERNELRVAAATNEQDAQRYRNTQAFLDDRNLSSDEAADLLEIGALAKVDPAKAWEMAKPWVQSLLIAAGEVLPDDLRGRVQNGELSQEAAMEVSRARAQAGSAQARQSFRDQQIERRQAQDLATSIRSEASSWETERKRRDPNFGAKLEPLTREVAWLQKEEGIPRTPEGVRDQLNRAYKTVNERFKPPAAVSRRPATNPVRGGQVAGNQQPQNRSTLDIVREHTRARR